MTSKVLIERTDKRIKKFMLIWGLTALLGGLLLIAGLIVYGLYSDPVLRAGLVSGFAVCVAVLGGAAFVIGFVGFLITQVVAWWHYG